MRRNIKILFVCFEVQSNLSRKKVFKRFWKIFPFQHNFSYPQSIKINVCYCLYTITLQLHWYFMVSFIISVITFFGLGLSINPGKIILYLIRLNLYLLLIRLWSYYNGIPSLINNRIRRLFDRYVFFKLLRLTFAIVHHEVFYLHKYR